VTSRLATLIAREAGALVLEHALMLRGALHVLGYERCAVRTWMRAGDIVARIDTCARKWTR
jgi:hypothetical protein